MAVEVVHNAKDTRAVLCCTVEALALPLVFGNGDDDTASEKAQDFLSWLGCDPRTVSIANLERKHVSWVLERVDSTTGNLKHEFRSAA